MQSFGIAVLLFLAACGKNAASPTTGLPATQTGTSPTAQASPMLMTSTPGIQPPHVSPYVDVTVESVQISYLDTDPVQVELAIHGTLPDQCRYGFYSVENRLDSIVRVKLSGIHPADTSCAKTVQTVEYTLLLGRDMPESERGFAPGSYQLVVNNYQVEFSIK